MNTLFGSRTMLKSRFFRNLLLSYSIIIILSFVAYSATVIYESEAIRKDQSKQYYDTKIQALSSAMDRQLYSAQNIVSNLNSSSLINKFYTNISTKQSVDSYLLYQVLNDIRLQKTASDNLNIYNIALFIDGYDKVYTSGEVIRLTEPVESEHDLSSSLEVSDLNDLFSMSNSQLIFYKQYFVFSGNYHYGDGSSRGTICVLYEKDKIDDLIQSILGNDAGYVLSFDGQPIMQGGLTTGKTFVAKSHINHALTYEIIADQKEFGVQISSLSSVALLFGLLVCILYLTLAVFFAYRYSTPFQKIRQLIGRAEKEEKDESKRLVAGVEEVLGERNGYLEQVTTISPYAEQGMIHSMLSGNMDQEKLNLLSNKDFVRLKHLFFSVAVIEIAYVGRETYNKEELRQIREMIEQQAQKQSDGEIKILCYERDLTHLYLIFNSDSGDKIEDTFYELFDVLKEQTSHMTYILTMGVDEVKEGLGELGIACEHAILSLEQILLEGRGGVYFYEPVLECSLNYYFPKEAMKRLVKSLKEKNEAELDSFLQEIKNENEGQELSSTAIQLLLHEWYMTSLKAVQSLNMQYSLTLLSIKKPGRMGIDELVEIYKIYCLDVMQKMEEGDRGKEKMQKLDREILNYINDNDRNPDISLAQIAERFKISTKYVTNLIKQQFGVTYLQYVQERRIAHAVELLKTSEYSLEKIAEECGYTNILTFRRNFKTIMKKNPSDFRGGVE